MKSIRQTRVKEEKKRCIVRNNPDDNDFNHSDSFVQLLGELQYIANST
jgi:hypothetical protein